MLVDSKGLSEILPFVVQSSDDGGVVNTWRPAVRSALTAVSRGSSSSKIASGKLLAEAILDIRHESELDGGHPGMPQGLSFFFDELLEEGEARAFFEDTLPAMAAVLLRLPDLLAAQAAAADEAARQAASRSGDGSSSSRLSPPQLPLQILHQQQAGLVLITQELATAILAGAFMCIFPTAMRGHDRRRQGQDRLPEINFDYLYTFPQAGTQMQEHKLRCVLHYFARVCATPPTGTLSFERKVLPLHAPAAGSSSSSEQGVPPPLPDSAFWETRKTALSTFTVHESGCIEDVGGGCVEVDFANKFLGGGVLGYGCLQEEIRFIVCLELVVGMLFLPEMAPNETIEIVGAERFCNYKGYAHSLRFTGSFHDTAPRDSLGRRQTRIVAMDALCGPGERQFSEPLLLREVNKVFCAFLDHAVIRGYGSPSEHPLNGGRPAEPDPQLSSQQNSAGVATGNWGCGAFGGDLEVKSMLQWLAASQAGRPTVLYFTFQDPRASRLEEVAEWVRHKGCSVGDLWALLVDYGDQRVSKKVHVGFFDWLLRPSEPSSAK